MAEDLRLVEALTQCREDEVKALVQAKLDAGVPATEIVAECNRGMVELGNRFAAGECFLPELMFGGMIMKSVAAELAPGLESLPSARKMGTAVLGSVQYDVHDIGKDIAVMMLRGAGFEVVDLGVDVAPEEFVAAIRAHRPMVLGMSVLLTTCFKSVVATVGAIQAAGLRSGLSVMVGGAAASELLSQTAGCDFYAKTAVDGMHYACRLAGAS